MEVDPGRFEEMVSTALDGLPEELGQLMRNVAVTVSTARARPACSGCTRASRSPAARPSTPVSCPTTSPFTARRSARSATPSRRSPTRFALPSSTRSPTTSASTRSGSANSAVKHDHGRSHAPFRCGQGAGPRVAELRAVIVVTFPRSALSMISQAASAETCSGPQIAWKRPSCHAAERAHTAWFSSRCGNLCSASALTGEALGRSRGGLSTNPTCRLYQNPAARLRLIEEMGMQTHPLRTGEPGMTEVVAFLSEAGDRPDPHQRRLGGLL